MKAPLEEQLTCRGEQAILRLALRFPGGSAGSVRSVLFVHFDSDIITITSLSASHDAVDPLLEPSANCALAANAKTQVWHEHARPRGADTRLAREMRMDERAGRLAGRSRRRCDRAG